MVGRLAWAARDQECRFDHALDWRSAASESRSPVRDWNRLDVRNTVRAFLRALTPAELETLERLSGFEGQVQATSRELENRNWEIDRLRERLLLGLDLPEATLSGGELDIQVLKQAATERFSKAAALPIGVVCVNRRAKLTPDRRPKLTPRLACTTGSARPGGTGRGCGAGASAVA